MRAKLMFLTFFLMNTIILCGCWDQNELPSFGFVQAVSIDVSEEDENKIILTTQFIKPSPKIGGNGSNSDEAFVNVQTEGDSTFEAIRDITNHLGRKAQWSHTRIILLSEEIVKKRGVGELLEFFYRDHEPRMLINLGITKGKAKDYLNVKPFIENTISQQLKELEHTAKKYSAKTVEATLLTFGTEMKSEVKVGKIPYYTMGYQQYPVVAGISVFYKEKMIYVLPPLESEGLLKLINEYESGIIELPCVTSKRNSTETLEVINSDSKIIPVFKGEDLFFDVRLNLDVSVGELKCSAIKNSEYLVQLSTDAEKVVKTNVDNTIAKLQEEKLDILEIGNVIYRHHPDKWKKVKEHWPDIFSKASYTVKVKVNITNSSSEVGEPFF